MAAAIKCMVKGSGQMWLLSKDIKITEFNSSCC